MDIKMKIKQSQLKNIIFEEMSKILREGVKWIDAHSVPQVMGRDDLYEPSDLKFVRDSLGPEYYVVDPDNVDEFNRFARKPGTTGPDGEEVVVLLHTISSPETGRENYFKTAHRPWKYGKVVGMDGGLAQPEPAFAGNPEGLAAHWDSTPALTNLEEMIREHLKEEMSDIETQARTNLAGAKLNRHGNPRGLEGEIAAIERATAKAAEEERLGNRSVKEKLIDIFKEKIAQLEELVPEEEPTGLDKLVSKLAIRESRKTK